MHCWIKAVLSCDMVFDRTVKNNIDLNWDVIFMTKEKKVKRNSLTDIEENLDFD